MWRNFCQKLHEIERDCTEGIGEGVPSANGNILICDIDIYVAHFLRRMTRDHSRRIRWALWNV